MPQTCVHGQSPFRPTHLLTLLDDAVPQILAAWREVFDRVSHHLLDGLLGAGIQPHEDLRSTSQTILTRSACADG